MPTDTGIVKFFNPAAEKRFGFVSLASGEEIFFHFGDGASFSLSTWRDQPDFSGTPSRDPRKGDRIVFDRYPGRRGKGDKARPWGFAEEFESLNGLNSAIRATQKPWGEPWLIGLESSGRGGYFCPTTYYQYYPVANGEILQKAWSAGLPIKKFDQLLVAKVGQTVVTGRTASFQDGGQLGFDKDSSGSEKPKESIHGLIPSEAADGFYFWNGQKWESCHPVWVKVTAVKVGDRITPANYGFVGVQRPNGSLVQNQVKLVCDQEFFSLGDNPELAAGRPVVEAAVRKDGWFTTRESIRWLEPDPSYGVDPAFEPYLNRLNEATIVRERLYRGIESARVWISIPGLPTREVEWHQECYIPNWPSDPGMIFMRSPERTWIGVTTDTRVSEFKISHPDPRLVDLSADIQSAPWVTGPVEEKHLATKGQFHFQYRGSSGGDVVCPHGWVVGHADTTYAGLGEGIEAMIRVWDQWSQATESCPFGCEPQPKGFRPQFIEEDRKLVDLDEYLARRQAYRDQGSDFTSMGYLYGGEKGHNVFVTRPEAQKQSILLVSGDDTTEFLLAPVPVVDFKGDLVDRFGRQVGKTEDTSYNHLYRVVARVPRYLHDAREAGVLEALLKLIK